MNEAFIRLAHSNGLTIGQVDSSQYLCKYYCYDCHQLKIPEPMEWPTHCKNCGSANIDHETDLESERLERLRFGLPEPIEIDGPQHIVEAKQAEGIIKTLSFHHYGLDESPDSDDRVTKNTLIEIGERTADVLYSSAKVRTEDDVEETMDEYLKEMSIKNPKGALVFSEAMMIPDQIILTLGSACWFKNGMPIIRLGHKRAAALMATEITEQSIEYVKAPFGAFYIELPDGLVLIEDSEKVMRRATGVLVHSRTFERDHYYGEKVKKAGTYWNYAILTDSALIQWKLSRLVEEIAGLKDRGNDWVGIGLPINNYDERVDKLIGRLICSTCIMMSNPENLRMKVEPAKRNKTRKKAARNSPTFKVFLERQPINVDVRRYVTSYLRGERDSPHVRLMVRGHHKMQHHGPKRALRKLIWVEPYMRGGDEGDPIMKSLYVAKDKDGKVPEAGGV
jgi:hypothetical protein